MSNVSLIDGHVDEIKTPILRSKDSLKQMEHAKSIIDALKWAKELGVFMTISFEDQSGLYKIGLHKDEMYTSVYISEQELRFAQPSYICGLILNAVRDLNAAIESKEESE